MAPLRVSAFTLALLANAVAAECPFDLAACTKTATGMPAIKACREKAVQCATSVADSMSEVMARCASRDSWESELNCDEVYEELTGVKRPLRRLDGLVDMVGSEMMKCDGSADECLAQMKELIKGRTGGELSEDRVKAIMSQAGEAEAGNFLRECQMEASSEADEESCKEEAKQKAAKASGKDVADIKDDFLKKAVRTSAEKDLAKRIRTCSGTASTDEATKACHASEDLKELVASSIGKSKDSVKDSVVAAYIARGGEGEALTVVKACAKGEADVCMEEAKRQMALAIGRPAGEISQDDVEHGVRRALSRDIVAIMDECMEDEALECSKCKDAAKDAMMEADMQGKTPDLQEVEEMLGDAAVTAAREMYESCGCSEQCRNSMKELVGRALGTCGKSVTDRRFMEIEEKATVQAVVDSMSACEAAEEDKGDATCDTPYEQFKAVCDTEELEKKLQYRRAEITAVGEKLGKCVRSGEGDCEKQLEETMQHLQMPGDVDTVKDRYHVQLLAGCEDKECRKAKMADALASGVNENEIATLKRVSEAHSAAEVWSTCYGPGKTEEDCDEEARATYEKESGSSDSFDAGKVRRLGKAIKEGEELVIVRRKRVDVTCSTDESTCSDDIKAKMALKAKKAAADNGKETTPIERPCRLVDGTAEYRALLAMEGASDEELESLSEVLPRFLLGMDLSARRLSHGRRLAEVTVTAAFAAQDMEECSPSDSLCLGLTVGTADSATRTLLAVACAFVGLAALAGAGL